MKKSIFRESSDIWDNVWNRDPYSTFGLRRDKAVKKIKMLREYVQINENSDVGDFGCGAGFLAEELYNHVNCKITGIDFSEVAIAQAKERLSGYPIKFLNGNINNTGLDSESLDLVICSGSIEHVKDVNDVLKECYRVLRPGGRIFITSSNKLSFMYFHRRYKEKRELWRYGFQKNWTNKELNNLLQINGFKVEENFSILGIGDFKIINLLDKTIATISKSWGRYIVLVGRKS